MNNENINNAAGEQIISQVLTVWQDQNKRVTEFFNKYPEDAYMDEVAEGRNRAVYLLGHLTAVNDALLPLLGLGDKLYPELAEPFLKEADNKTNTTHSVAALKEQWAKVNDTLTSHFSTMQPSDWLGRHTSVSEEDFAKEPHRNKLNVILGRTNHQSYHIGQLAFLRQPALAN